MSTTFDLCFEYKIEEAGRVKVGGITCLELYGEWCYLDEVQPAFLRRLLIEKINEARHRE